MVSGSFVPVVTGRVIGSVVTAGALVVSVTVAVSVVSGAFVVMLSVVEGDTVVCASDVVVPNAVPVAVTVLLPVFSPSPVRQEVRDVNSRATISASSTVTANVLLCFAVVYIRLLPFVA